MANGTVQSVDKAIRLLNEMAMARRPLTLGELALRSAYPKSTVHGLLSSLRQGGLVHQSDQDGRYSLGVRLFELGSLVRESWNILSQVQPYMQNISIQTGESVDLAILDGNELLIIGHEDATNNLRVVTTVGARMPLHCTALGKALLAALTDTEAKRMIQKEALVSYTPHTLTDASKLINEIAAIRGGASAIENGEYRIGLRAVASPINTPEGTPRYALAVTGMFNGIETEPFKKAAALVQRTAEVLSKQYRNL